jgi:TolB-like protein/class 3 adenylate cyclase
MGGVDTSRPVVRRLAAIVAADVAGYSRLMGLDEVGTAEALRQHRAAVDPIVARHGGRIVKTTGDGVLLEFPSVVAAVECAVAVQKLMAERSADVPEDRRMLFRFGINVGDVLVQGDDILGDGVNVAARLEGIAEPGGICVSDDVYRQVSGKLDVAFDDMGEQQLKNIARPVRVYRAGLGHLVQSGSLPTLPLPDKPSIAVLPFQNMSGDPEQEYFADGMVEDIITALAHLPWLFVISRNSSFTYKGRAVDVKRVGRELGVRYVLEGSVRRMGNRIRITGQLIDATNGAHLWADRFEGSLEDIFALQDDVAARVAGTLGRKLEFVEAERTRRKPSENLDAYDHFLRGRTLQRKFTPESLIGAASHFRKAIELDPRFAQAHASLGQTHAFRISCGWSDDHDQDRIDGLRYARRAVQLGWDDALALITAAGEISSLGRDFDTSLMLAERALSLNPNLSEVWHRSGWINSRSGNHARAIECAARAMRLTPVDPDLCHLEALMAFSHFYLGRYDEAVAWAMRSDRERPAAPYLLRMLAASCAMAGRLDDARQAVARTLTIDPDFRVSGFADTVLWRRPEDFARYEEALRKAGFPE